MRGRVALLLGSLIAGGCSEGVDLAVDLRTDFAPGREFVAVRTELFRGSERPAAGRTPDAREDSTAPSRDDFIAGRRVAEFRPIEEGDWWVRATLLDARGDALASRAALATVRGNLIVSIVIARTCDAEECRDECAEDVDCAAEPHAPCATPVCVEGLCLLAANDPSCGAGMICDVVAGCAGPRSDGGPSDAGPADAGPGEMDSGPPPPPPVDSGGGCTGECAPGATSSRDEVCGPCGVTRSCSRTCNASCTWDPESCGACPGVAMCTDYFGATHCPGARGCANCGAELCVTCTCGGGGGWETCDGPICG